MKPISVQIPSKIKSLMNEFDPSFNIQQILVDEMIKMQNKLFIQIVETVTALPFHEDLIKDFQLMIHQNKPDEKQVVYKNAVVGYIKENFNSNPISIEFVFIKTDDIKSYCDILGHNADIIMSGACSNCGSNIPNHK